jgi:purine-nucleoside phosphorylase
VELKMKNKCQEFLEEEFPTKVGNVLFNDVFIKSFLYNSVEKFIEEMTKISNEAVSMEGEDGVKITIKFHSKFGTEFILRYYGVTEFLLFVNGLQLVQII